MPKIKTSNILSADIFLEALMLPFVKPELRLTCKSKVSDSISVSTYGIYLSFYRPGWNRPADFEWGTLHSFVSEIRNSRQKIEPT